MFSVLRVLALLVAVAAVASAAPSFSLPSTQILFPPNFIFGVGTTIIYIFYIFELYCRVWKLADVEVDDAVSVLSIVDWVCSLSLVVDGGSFRVLFTSTFYSVIFSDGGVPDRGRVERGRQGSFHLGHLFPGRQVLPQPDGSFTLLGLFSLIY